MHNLNAPLRLMIEAVFVLVGLFLLWVSFTGRYIFDPRRPSWLLLSVLLIIWGIQRWWGGRRSPVRKFRWATQVGGASLTLAGLLMLSLVWSPLGWVNWLVMATGGVFILRGLAAALLLALR